MSNKRAELFRKAEIITSDTELFISMKRPEAFFNENQGGCTDGRYYYQTFMHRDRESNEENNSCKIAKIDLQTKEIVQWSDVFTTLNHCNDIVYNSRRDILVVVHNNPNRQRLTLIDPRALTAVGTVELDLNIYAIDYSAERDMYVVAVSGGQDLMFLDADFKRVDGKLHKATEKTAGYVTQGICADEELIYCVLFDGKGFHERNIRNVATVYDWNGNYVGILEFDAGYTEPENISIAGEDFYLVSCFDTFNMFKLRPKLK